MCRISGKILFGIMLSILFFVAFSDVSVSKASDGPVTIEVSPRGTYLHADSQNGENVDSLGIVDLQGNGFSEGDAIMISFEGFADYGMA